MKELLEYLESISSGPISDPSELVKLLSYCWDEFEGGDAAGMTAYKLERMEDANWEPPILRFRIERHGAAALGSTRAEVQEWEIDVRDRSASFRDAGRRQIYPMQPRVDVRATVEQIVDLIVHRRQNGWLKWRDDGSVRVLVGKILPKESTVRRTLEGRRRRFREHLDDRLCDSGWRKIGQYVYATPAD